MVDIYDDLEHFDFSEEVHKLREENITLMDRTCTLEIENKRLSDKYTLLEKETKELRTNISSLHKTSTSELQRKEKTILELRQQVESLNYKFDKSVYNRNADREKYPSDKALANHRESHLTDTISSSNSNRPNYQDRYTSKQTLRTHNLNDERYLPDKALVKRHQIATRRNSYEKTLDYNVDCIGNEGKQPVISNSNLPNLREVELENSISFELNNMSKINETKENQSKLLQSIVKTEIEETQHTYIRNKIEERRIELTKLEFEKDYLEAESKLKNFENKSSLVTPPRQCLSSRITKLSHNREDSLKHINNKRRSRSRSCERFYKIHKKRSGSPYRNVESKRVHRDQLNYKDKKINYDSKHQSEKYDSHRHKRHGREDENKNSSRRFERSERNDKYIKTSVERHDFRKKKWSPVYFNNISTATIENNSSNIDVKIQYKKKEDQYQSRVSADISVSNSESWKRSPPHTENNSRTKSENKTPAIAVVSHSKSIHKQCENSKEDQNILTDTQKSAVENSLPVDLNHRVSSDRKEENTLYIATDEIVLEEGEIVMDEHDSNAVQCTSINTTTYTNENKSEHFENRSDHARKPKVMNSSLKCDNPSLTNSTGNLSIPVRNSAQLDQVNSSQIEYNTNKSDLSNESSNCMKKHKIINSLKCDNRSSTKLAGNSAHLDEINSNHQAAFKINENKRDHIEESLDPVKKSKVINSPLKCDNRSSTKSAGNSAHLDEINSNHQAAFKTNENKRDHIEESLDPVKKSKVINSPLKCDNRSSTKSAGNSTHLDEINSNRQVAFKTNENKRDHIEESLDPVKKSKVINSPLKCDNRSSTKSAGNSTHLDEINSNRQVAFKTNENKRDHIEESLDPVKKSKVINSPLKCDNRSSTKLAGNSAHLDEINSNHQAAFKINENKRDHIEESLDPVKKSKVINSPLKCDNRSSTKSAGNSAHLDEINSNHQVAFKTNENKRDHIEESLDPVKKSKVINSPLKCDNRSSTKSAGNSTHMDEINSNRQVAFKTNENKRDHIEESLDPVKKSKVINSPLKCDNRSSTKSAGNSAHLDEINSNHQAAFKTNEKKKGHTEESLNPVKKLKVINSISKSDSLTTKSTTKLLGNLNLSSGNSAQMNSNHQIACKKNENKRDHFEESSNYVKKPKVINSSSKCDNPNSTKSTVNLSSSVGNSAQLDQLNSNCQAAYNTNQNKSDLLEESSYFVKKSKVVNSSLKCDDPSSIKSTGNLNPTIGNPAQLNQINSSHQKIITKQPRKIQYSFSESSKTISSENPKGTEKCCEQVSNMPSKIVNESSLTDNKDCNSVSKDRKKSDLKSTPNVSLSVQGNTENTFHVKIFRQRTIIKKFN